MSQGLRIAVADDERDIRDYFRRLLPLLGHQVVVLAQDGRELIEQCRAVQPDLVITDIRMPNLDGIRAAEVLRREGPTPVILMSTHFGPEPSRCAEGDHILGRLAKPIRQADLLPLLDLARQRVGV
jgi:response regulator NasT